MNPIFRNMLFIGVVVGASGQVGVGAASTTLDYPTCATVPHDIALDKKLADHHKLYPLMHVADVSVEIHFNNDPPLASFKRQFKGIKGADWSLVEQQRVCAAASEVSRVWSSQAFSVQLGAFKSLILQEGTVKGDWLYGQLVVSGKTVKETVSVEVYGGNEVAITTKNTETWIQKWELDGDLEKTATDPDLAIVADLTNTISHEYTHFDGSIASLDSGHCGLDPHFVSYQTGGLTQNIAFPDIMYSFGSGCRKRRL